VFAILWAEFMGSCETIPHVVAVPFRASLGIASSRAEIGITVSHICVVYSGRSYKRRKGVWRMSETEDLKGRTSNHIRRFYRDIYIQLSELINETSDCKSNHRNCRENSNRFLVPLRLHIVAFSNSTSRFRSFFG
jgi:hypothetical protein